jgi:hypothetical protein
MEPSGIVAGVCTAVEDLCQPGIGVDCIVAVGKEKEALLVLLRSPHMIAVELLLA